MARAIAPDVFVGREAELAELRLLYDRASGGQTYRAIVEGEMGSGKTALVERFVSELPRAARIQRVSSESIQVRTRQPPMREAGDGRAVAASSPGASDVLREAAAELNRTLLAEIGSEEDQVTVLVFDDAERIDGLAWHTLLFALRRSPRQALLALFVVRSDKIRTLPLGVRRMAQQRNCAWIQLGPLPASDVAQLAEACGISHLSPRVVELLRGHTVGNPLDLRELLTELPAGAFSRPMYQLPATRRTRARVAASLSAVSQPTRRFLEACAIVGSRFRLAAIERITGLTIEGPMLDEAVATTLIAVHVGRNAGWASFASPIVQTGVHDGIGSIRRRCLHFAAAEETTDEWEALRHRAAASPSGDDSGLSDEVAVFAEAQRTRGAWIVGATGFLTAADLSPDEERRQSRVLDAVYSLLYAGDVQHAAEYGTIIDAYPPSARKDAILGFLAGLKGDYGEAAARTQLAWEHCDQSQDPGLAAFVAGRLAMHHLHRLHGHETVAWSSRATQLAERVGRRPAFGELLPLGVGLAYAGDMAGGLAAIDRAIEQAADAQGPAGGISLKRARGWLRRVIGDLEGARADLTEDAVEARRLGSAGTEAFALAHLAQVDYLAGRWDDAMSSAARAVEITVQRGHPFLQLAVFAAALVGSARGMWSDVEQWLELSQGVQAGFEQTVVLRSLAYAHRAEARSDPKDVLVSLAPVIEIQPREGVDEPGFWPWQHLYAAALISVGRLDDAETLLQPHEIAATKRDRALQIARLAVIRGLLCAARGEPRRSTRSFENAHSILSAQDLPFELAKAQLAWGQSLRSRSQRLAAAKVLKASGATLEQLGAEPYLAMCRHELRACGVAVRSRAAAPQSRLTDREITVARLVASGMTNREVAEDLVLATRTVEFHLTRIYSKLNVTSRSQLAAFIGDTGLA